MQGIWSADTPYDGKRPDNDDGGPLSEEVVTLRRRVGELEPQLPETHRSGAARAEGGFAEREGRDGRGALLDLLSLNPAEQAALLDALPAMIFFKDREHRYLLVNKAYADHYRVSVERIVGRRDEEIFVAETARQYHESDEAVMASGEPRLNVELHWRLADGSEGWTMENDVPYRDARGRVVGMVGIGIDVTARKRAEQALLRAEAELLETRERLLDTISALSTPVLPIDDGILVVPLVGHIDEERGGRIMETLLQGVERHRADVVIIDLTGVPVIDGAVTGHLLSSVHAARLLGAQCVLVGVSPAIARSLVQSGVDVRELVLLKDLRAGVRHALARRSRRAAARAAT
ncbi:PAS domain-containing protein [Sorangium sp. So ce385]|uniref:PAS domain-containing protein n=1 Tax=Sorangium sp. So ce385 TaxID=3133308 RepID=UPI003F5C00C6